MHVGCTFVIIYLWESNLEWKLQVSMHFMCVIYNNCISFDFKSHASWLVHGPAVVCCNSILLNHNPVVSLIGSSKLLVFKSPVSILLICVIRCVVQAPEITMPSSWCIPYFVMQYLCSDNRRISYVHESLFLVPLQWLSSSIQVCFWSVIFFHLNNL